jgi:hypothetical protein
VRSVVDGNGDRPPRKRPIRKPGESFCERQDHVALRGQELQPPLKVVACHVERRIPEMLVTLGKSVVAQNE